MHVRVFRRRTYPRTYAIDVRVLSTYVFNRRTYSMDVRDSAMDDFGTTRLEIEIRDYAEHSGSDAEDRHGLVFRP